MRPYVVLGDFKSKVLLRQFCKDPVPDGIRRESILETLFILKFNKSQVLDYIIVPFVNKATFIAFSSEKYYE
jgi:hypothetical protein